MRPLHRFRASGHSRGEKTPKYSYLKLAQTIGSAVFSRQTFAIVTGLYIYYRISQGPKIDSQDDESSWFFKPLRKPKSFLKVTSLNEKYDGYANSVGNTIFGPRFIKLNQKQQKLLKLVLFPYLTFL